MLKAWRLQQLGEWSGAHISKEQVLKAVESVRPSLDEDVWRLYRTAGHIPDALTLKDFKRTHEPMHWLLEFPGIEASGGFDVIVGNPPFLEVREIDYVPKPLRTRDSAAIHAMCCEVSLALLKPNGFLSLVMPMSIVSTQRMKDLQALIEHGRSCWYLNFAWRPAKLFDAVNRAITVFVSGHSPALHTRSTGYLKWSSEAREPLFETASFVEVGRDRPQFWVPKLSEPIETVILKKLLNQSGRLSAVTATSGARVYYRTDGGLYWKLFTDFPPAFTINGKPGISSRQTSFTVKTASQAKLAVATLSSSLFWWWYTVTSNLRHLNPADINGFPIPNSVWEDEALLSLADRYLEDIKANSRMMERVQKQTGVTQTQSFSMARSKAIIDEIDSCLGRHYGFSDAEISYIQTYDCKFRLSSLGEDAED